MPQTLAQKILQAHTDDVIERDGQIVQCRLSLVLANDITGPLAIKSFKGMGASRVFDKDKIALVMDHFTPQKDIASANQVMISRQFAQEQGITHYYEGGDCGVEHTLLPERGLVGPGDVVIGADSHTCTYGGIGAFATGMGSTDIAAGMALGETWIKVPPTIRVNINGQMPKWLRGKDLMLLLIKTIGVDGALYKSMEFTGEGVASLSMDDRLCICNMAIEAGAKNGIFPVDQVTKAYMEGRCERQPVVFEADADAEYEQTVTVDLSALVPVVSCPHLPENTRPASELSDVKIDQVVIGSCTNGRMEDMETAWRILNGKKVADGVRCIIIPATMEIMKECVRRGYVSAFLEAGAVVSTPTCGPCLGGYMGILAAGERCIATTNRNFVGRMGDPTSEVYLASPAVAAASAILGYIASAEEVK